MEYRSDSTIDNPPREPREGKDAQVEAFPAELEEIGRMIEAQAIPSKYEVKLELQLKPVGRKTGEIKRVITHGKCPPQYVRDIIQRAICSSANEKFLEAMCGEPSSLDQKLQEIGVDPDDF